MIRLDLKEKLNGKNLDEFFKKNRPGIDQPGYRVGKVGEDIIRGWIKNNINGLRSVIEETY